MRHDHARRPARWRISAAIAVLLVPIALVALAAPPLAEVSWRAHYDAAMQAYGAHDWTRFRDEMAAASDAIGGHPRMTWNLACAEARLGSRKAALAQLRTYVATGMTRDATADSDLASLWGDPKFAEINRNLKENARPIAHASITHRFDDPDLLPEDVSYDPVTRHWFVSSITRRQVVEIDADGHELSALGADDSTRWGVFAVAIDSTRRRLWFTTVAVATMMRPVGADSGRTTIECFDLGTRRRLVRLEPREDGAPHLFGDMALGADGSAYVSDGIAGGVYRVPPGLDSLETVVPAGVLESPQSPAVTADGRALLIADYTRGIARVDLASGRLQWLVHGTDLAVMGIDGLYVSGRDLIAVQNGARPPRVVRFRLDGAGTRVLSAEVLERASLSLGQPNHGVLVGSDFVFIGNSGWDRVDERQLLRSEARAQAPTLLRVTLPR